jgi:transglutaminase-like putative cysteine protease
MSGVEDWMRANYRYRDESEEILRSPEFMLNDFDTLGYCEGDCDDCSTLIAALGKSLGYPVRFSAIKVQTPDEFDHVFTEYMNPGGTWIPVDPTVPQGTTYTIYGQTVEGV